MSIESFFVNVTPAQAELVSAAGGVVSVLLAAVLAPLVFHLITRKGVADFKAAIEDVTTSARTVREHTSGMGEEINQLGEKLVEINALLSAVQKNQAVSQSKSEEEERAIEALTPESASGEQTPRAKLKEFWSRIRDRLEDVASDSAIDGRIRARYARIDRRDYQALVRALGSEGRLGSDQEKWLRSVFLWYKFRPNNQEIDPVELNELGELASFLEARQYEQPEADNLGLADRIRRDACANKLPAPLTAALVKERYPGYSAGATQTVLANYAEGGLWPGRGQKARFRKTAQGEYSAICDAEFAAF